MIDPQQHRKLLMIDDWVGDTMVIRCHEGVVDMVLQDCGELGCLCVIRVW